MAINLLAPIDALQVIDPAPNYARKLTQLSTAAGKFSVRPMATAPKATHSLTLELTSLEEIDEFWTWYDDILGAYGGFGVPSYQRDLVPLDTIGPADLTFDIQARGYTDLELPANRYAIVFVLGNGSLIQRQINEAVDNLDGTETLTMNAALGVSFTQSSNNGICFLLYGRLSEDKVSMEWLDHHQATVNFQMVELPAPLIEATGLDAGLGVWGTRHGGLGGAGYYYIRYDLSPYVEPSHEYVLRFLVQSLGGQPIDVIGFRICHGSACNATFRSPGMPWIYVDRTFSSDVEGNFYADVGHFAMQIGSAAIVEIAWLAIYDPNEFPSLDDPIGNDLIGPVPPAIPGNFVALIPLGTYTLHYGTARDGSGCPPSTGWSHVCPLLLDDL